MYKSLSRRQVACSECEEICDSIHNLKTHFERKHPEKPWREKNQPSIASHFKPGTKRPLSPDIKTMETKQDLAQTKARNIESFSPEPSPSFEPPPRIPVPSNPSADSSADILFNQMQEVLNNWSNYGGKAVGIDTFSTPSQSTSSVKKDSGDFEIENKDQIKACRCVKDFENLLDDMFRVDRETEILTCLTCEESDSEGKRNIGVFSLAGVEFEKLAVKSRKLRNLETHILRHLSSDFHKKQTSQKQDKDAAERLKRQRNLEVGRKLGSLVIRFFITRNRSDYLKHYYHGCP